MEIALTKAQNLGIVVIVVDEADADDRTVINDFKNVVDSYMTSWYIILVACLKRLKKELKKFLTNN